MKDSLEDWLVAIKYIPKNYISKIKTRHTIVCPRCFKIYHQILPYRDGQNTLCKKCRNRLSI